MNAVILEDEKTPLDIASIEYNQSAQEVWTDGTLDSTGIPKVLGYVAGKSSGVVHLSNGDQIVFSKCRKLQDGTIVIIQPYRRVKP